MVLSPLLINHIQKFNDLWPNIETKGKAAHRRGQGQGQGQGQGHKILSSRCPRGRVQSSRTPSLVRPSPTCVVCCCKQKSPAIDNGDVIII